MSSNYSIEKGVVLLIIQQDCLIANLNLQVLFYMNMTKHPDVNDFFKKKVCDMWRI